MKRSTAALLAALLLLSAAGTPGAAASDRAYLIGSRAPLTDAQVRQLKAAGASIAHRYRNFGGAAGTIAASKLDAVRALPFVTSVRPDTVRQLDALRVAAAPAGARLDAPLPGDAMPWWLDAIDAEDNASYDGSGVWVAVLDSGMYPNWRDYFKESSILGQYGRAFNGAGFSGNLNWEAGSDPHGMAVAATIVGHRFVDRRKEGGWGEGFATGDAGTYWIPGVAEGARIIPIQVCIPLGCFGSAINAGIDYVTSLKLANPDQPIVINESLGGPGLDPVEKAALDAAIAAGVVVVASAGNSGNGGMGFPGAYEPVISVAAGGWQDQWNDHPDKTWWLDDVPEGAPKDHVFITDFSSRQKSGQYLDVAGPGRFMLLPYPCANLYKDGQIVQRTLTRTCASKASPDNATSAPFQYLFMSGTSFSAPAVAGIVALMLDKDPGLSNADATFGSLGDPGSWGPGDLESKLEGSAFNIPPDEVLTVYRTGIDDWECWEKGPTGNSPGCSEQEATGAGWVTIPEALAAVP